MIAFYCLFALIQTSLGDNFSEKIIGGNTVSIEEYPYQLSVRIKDTHFCGAAILSEKYAITAAHCTQGVDVRLLSILSGISSLDDKTGQIIRVEKIYQHPEFSLALMDYDLSIIKFADNIEFSEKAWPIEMIQTDESLVGEVGVVTGWGVDRENKREATNDLQAVEVPIVNQEICRQKYNGLAPITPRMFCAEDENGGRDACQGDSGGPFAVNGVLVGVVSWGLGCGEAEYPGVYANISAMKDFIHQVLD